jgi:uncharacterized protein
MTVELKPLGNKCNIQCTYCYQKFMRSGEEEKKYNIPLMLKRADELLKGSDRGFAMFGGEPLLVPLEDLEAFFAHGLKNYRKNSIQTNGTLITDHHIKLFNSFNVSVGISIDGPGICNDARRIGSLENTRLSTKRTEQNIEKLIANNIVPSLICTLHRINYSNREIFLEWIVYLEKIGIKHIRLHFLENDDVNDLVLKSDELTDFVLSILKLNSRIRFDIFDDIQNQLLYTEEERREKKLETSCVWNACDSLNTSAVQGIDGNGNVHNCGRTNKTEVDYLKNESHGRERTIALYYTPQESKGCKGCDYFFACKGHCPGEGEKGDWRNRTEFCETIKSIFKEFEDRIEKIGRVPISKNIEEREKVVKKLLTTPEMNYTHGDIPHGDAFHFTVPVRGK